MIKTIAQNHQKVAGAKSHLGKSLNKNVRSTDIDEVWYDEYGVDERTEIVMSKVTSIINKAENSIGEIEFAINPYERGEQGDANFESNDAQNFWGFDSGYDFERKILVKENAVSLLEEKLRSRSWKAAPITIGRDVECYQPVERKLKITRQLLEVFLKYKHPVQITTKSSLVLRDLDLLTELNKFGLVSVAITVNTLNNELHKAMEPRTATPKKRMHTVKVLASRGIPVTVVATPIIPGLNDEGIFTLVKVAADHGASALEHTIVRLTGVVGNVFKDWVRKSFPYRWRKILRKVAEMHQGKYGSADHGSYRSGAQNYADMINQQFAIAKKTYGLASKHVELSRTLFDGTASPQMSLF